MIPNSNVKPCHIDEFIKIRQEIERKDKNYRFACDDSWIEKVTDLKTDIGTTRKGTPIGDVGT